MVSFKKSFIAVWALVAVCTGCLGCSDEIPAIGGDEPPTSTDPVSPTRYLYVAASGISATTGCYAGGATTSGATAPNVISRYDLTTGAFDKVVVDYSIGSAGDIPLMMHRYDDSHIVVLVENATSGRRLDRVDTATGEIVPFYVNGTALSGVLREFIPTLDGGYLVSKSTAIEKIFAPTIRTTVLGNSFVSAPAGNCATSATLISALVQLSNGNILMAHAAASPNNKISFISANGYATAADCLNPASYTAPVTTALPTAMIQHSTGKLLVAYGSVTLGSNFVYSYDIDGGASTLSAATAAYTNTTIVQGPTAMVEDRETGEVFIANGKSTLNTVEKFTFASGALSRVGTTPYIAGGIFTRCISGLYIGY